MENQSTLPAPATITSAGVDWLTATAYRTPQRQSFYDLGNDLISRAARLGNDVANWKQGGYHGRKTSGVALGVRHDTYIIRLSSDEAREHWREVEELSTNISRVDVQITFEFESALASFVASQRDNALTLRKRRGRAGNVTLISSSLDGDSVYLGKRTSDVYARIYDKGREEKSNEAGKLIRQELEFKGDRAKMICSQLREAKLEAIEANNIVSTYLKSYGVQTTANGATARQGARGKTTQNDARCAWLRSSCAPTVRRLIDSGRLADVLDALGLSGHCAPIDNKHDES